MSETNTNPPVQPEAASVPTPVTIAANDSETISKGVVKGFFKIALILLGIGVGIGFIALLIAVVEHAPTSSPQASPSVTTATPTSSAPASSWSAVNSRTNPVTGVVTKSTTTGYGKQSIVVRIIGKRLEVYIDTGEFIETVGSVETGRIHIAYKFDDGTAVRASWDISSDHEAAFATNPKEFVRQMIKAKELSFQYEPDETTPQTVTFGVSGLPAVELGIDDLFKADNAAAAHKAEATRVGATAVATLGPAFQRCDKVRRDYETDNKVVITPAEAQSCHDEARRIYTAAGYSTDISAMAARDMTFFDDHGATPVN